MAIQTEAEAFWYLPENLTAQQQQQLNMFRAQLTKRGQLVPGQDGDLTLLRFLKARQWNVEPAAAMYTAMGKWRTENKVDELYANFEFPELKALLEHYPHFYHKQDKYGRPVYIELLGSIDCGKMLEVASRERILQYHIWTWERLQRQLMPAASAAAGRPVQTCTVIIDLKGLSLKSFSLTAKRLLTAVTQIDQDNYPEHLGTMFIINAPYIFTTIWSVVAALLEERTKKKIMVLGSDYLPKLTKLIPIENLPTFFGGQSHCRDHMHSDGAWTAHEPCVSHSWLPVGPSGHNKAPALTRATSAQRIPTVHEKHAWEAPSELPAGSLPGGLRPDMAKLPEHMRLLSVLDGSELSYGTLSTKGSSRTMMTDDLAGATDSPRSDAQGTGPALSLPVSP